MALSVVHHLRDRLQSQTVIDADFSTMMFALVDEEDKIARKRMLEDCWGLKGEGTGHLICTRESHTRMILGLSRYCR